MTEKELYEIKLKGQEKRYYDLAKERFDSIAKPIDGLGSFEDMVCKIAMIQKTDRPDISKKALIVMISDNGVVSENVTQTGKAVTKEVAKMLGMRSSTVAMLCKDMPVEIIPVDVGIDTGEKIPGVIDAKIARGTENISKTCAMTKEQCLLAIETGIGQVKLCRDRGIKVIATGEMGIGNTTTATAMLCALCGEEPENITGRGAGLSDEGLSGKTDVIKRTLELHGLNTYVIKKPDKNYTFDVMTAVGGFDIAALAGVYIGCAIYEITAVMDGLITMAAAVAASLLVPGCEKFILASINGREKGCRVALDHLGMDPVIDAKMALGEGTGAVMLLPLLDMVMSLYDNAKSFDESGIERYTRK